MASIPLLALDVKNYQQPDVLQRYGQLAQLKNMQQEAQIRAQQAPLQQQALQQQVQQGQIATQQAQQGQQDQQAFREAMQDPSMQGQTIGGIADALAKKGAISQAGWIAAKKADLDHQTSLAGLTKDQLANLSAGHAATQQLYNNIQQLPDDQLAQNWPQIAQQYNSIPGNEKAPLNPQQPLTKQQLAQVPALISMNEAYLNDAIARKKASVDEQTAEADLQQKQNNLVNGPTGPAAQAKYRFILQKQASGQPLLPDELSFAKAYEASEAKQTTTSDTLGVSSSNFSKPAGLAATGVQPRKVAPASPNGSAVAPPAGSSMTPAQIKSGIVDEIGNYKTDPALLGRMMYKHPEILGMVNQKYPDWDQTTYNAKNNLVKGYTSGSQSKEINAINTAMGHVKVLDDAIAALNNGDVQLLNKIGNTLGVQLGSTPQTTFRTIVHRVGPEISSAYIPGGGGEGERATNANDFSENMAPDQLHNNAAITVQLLRSKVGSLGNQYKNTVGRDDFVQRFITPEAQAAFQRFAPSGGAPTAPGGTGVSVGSVVTQNGHKYKVTAVDASGKPTAADPVQ